MAFTPNKNLEQPINGAYVGTWDVPVNSNWGLIDSALGGSVSIALGAANVTLSAAQYQNFLITFTGALTANIAVTFPAIGSFYTILNQTTNSSVFVVTAVTSVSTGRDIGLPPGEMVDIVTDGSNVRFKNIGRIGSYWDYAGSSVPSWVTACTVPPYLNCDGSAFSSVTYPALAVVLGGTTLPDARGRVRAVLNQGTGRMSSTLGGVDGNTKFSAAGADSITLATFQIPAHTHTVTDPGHTHATGFNTGAITAGGDGYRTVTTAGSNVSTNTTGISIQNTGGGGHHVNMQPTFVGGLTLIRAG